MTQRFGLAWRYLGLCALMLVSSPASSQPSASPCGPIANAYGPFDYRTQRDRLAIVERHHFQPHIEALRRLAGASHADLGGNLDYTLRASPNHHRALIAMVRYAERERLPRVVGADYTVDCYFDRAIQFAPDDAIVRMLFAGYLARQNKQEFAEKQLEFAAVLAGNNPFTLYNVGISYLELKRYDKALEFDHKAKALGWPRKDLENRLREAGKWTDPQSVALRAEAASEPATAQSTSAAVPSASAADQAASGTPTASGSGNARP